MSDRPTPETDKYTERDWWTLFRANEHSRKLERERDEAREENKKLRDIIEIAISIGKGKVGFPDWGFICEEFYKLKEGAK